jgi:ribosomal RNA-processing protein 8
MPSDAIKQKVRDNHSKSSVQSGVNNKKKKKNKNKIKHESKNSNTNQLGAPSQGPKLKATLPPPAAAPSLSKKKGGSLLDQMRQKLQGGQFRWLNEQLYTTAGDNALSLMRKNPELYDKYHEGEF